MKQYTIFKKLFNESQFVADNVSPTQDGVVDTKYSALGKIITTGCWAFTTGLQGHRNYMGEQIQKLQEARDKFTGTDVSNANIERRIDYIQNLEVTEEALMIMSQMFKDLHQELYSEEYHAPVKKSVTKKVTQATNDADALLNKYNKYVVTDK